MTLSEEASILARKADEMRRSLMVGIGGPATKDDVANVAMLVGQLATIVRALVDAHRTE